MTANRDALRDALAEALRDWGFDALTSDPPHSWRCEYYKDIDPEKGGGPCDCVSRLLDDLVAAALAGSGPEAGLRDERLWRAFMEYGVHQDGCHLETTCWCGYAEALTYAMALAATPTETPTDTDRPSWRTDSVPCPKCGVAAGKPCLTSGGVVRFDYPHYQRQRDALAKFRAASPTATGEREDD